MKPSTLLRRIGWVLIGFGAVFSGLSGCNSISFQTARTLDKGTSKFYIAPSAMNLSIGGQPTTMPFVEVGTRYGLTDEIEVGGHIGAGLGFDTKISLVRPADYKHSWDISLAPGLGYIGGFSGTPTGGDSMHYFGLTLPLMITRHFGDTFSVTAGPRAMYLLQTVASDGGQSTHIVSVGSSLAVAIRVTDSFSIVPGVALSLPVVRVLSDFGSDAGVGGQRLMQFGIGFAFSSSCRIAGKTIS